MSTWHMQFLWEFHFPSETLYLNLVFPDTAAVAKKFSDNCDSLYESVSSLQVQFTLVAAIRHLQNSTHFSQVLF